ncbi:hypothetical protein PENSTE_c005G04112 [Penicillium steckii]|uniref:BZIP domain-containing protein n=1 Tax=Penicillium steckii TaxID=303698 RepID=A0A1V6TLL3_9EURO|nr:hypothetical protein PENSTE_c005G04112 [Penicillium steckii]
MLFYCVGLAGIKRGFIQDFCMDNVVQIISGTSTIYSHIMQRKLQGSKPRVRTSTQMERKRLLDRENQRIRRQRVKDRIMTTQNELELVKRNFKLAMIRLGSLQIEMEVKELQYSGQLNSQIMQSSAASNDSNPSGTLAMSRSGIPNNPIRISCQCYCGDEHNSILDCFCYGCLCLLLNAHMALQQDVLMPLLYPRTPKLADLLLLESDSNPISQFIGTHIKRFGPAKLTDIAAVYLIIYRLLRWRLYPVQETYRDIPQWYLPTTLQLSQPHSLCVDFLAWPDLRDYLIASLDPIQQVSFNKMIGESITVDWSSDEEFLIRDEHGALALNPAFEEHIFEYSNWKIHRDPWGLKNSHLTHLVNITD